MSSPAQVTAGSRHPFLRGAGLAPAIATRRTTAAVTCILTGAGGLTAFALTWVPGATVPGAHIGAVRLIGALAVLGGLGLMALRDIAPFWASHVLSLSGAVFISLMIGLSGGGDLAVSLATLYVMVPVHAFIFFHRRLAAVYTAFAVLLAVPLCYPLDVLPWPVAMCGLGISVITGSVVGWLVRLAERAERDGVTGLLNRRGFDLMLEQTLEGARHAQGHFSVGYLDLDHFRKVNETVGRDGGDALLNAVARRWQAQLPPGTALAHCGGEFMVLLPEADLERAAQIVESLRVDLPHQVAASAGIAEWQDDDTASVLLSRTDASLFRAKRAGRNRMDPQVGLSTTVRELAEGLRTGALVVLFQPIVDLETGMTVAAEALVRWDHPTRGRVGPTDFIPIAEESGLIVELGRQVLVQACGAVRGAEVEGRYLGKVTVNVAGAQLLRPEFAAEVLAILDECGLDPSRLIVEVTESSVAAEHGAAVEALETLRRHGVYIAIDDFGTGYSSLSRLAQLPVDILKIDRSFVQSVVPGRSAPIIASITALAEALSLGTVAEGIESPDQAEVLARHGCQKGQGWLFGYPGPMGRLQLPPVPSHATPGTGRRVQGLPHQGGIGAGGVGAGNPNQFRPYRQPLS